MWINRETWRRASRSSRRWGPLVAGSALFGAFTASVPWSEALAHLRERRDERAAVAPYLAEAKLKPVTFPEVVASHPAYLHKLVYWEVTVQSSTSSYASGRPAWPVVWTNPERLPKENMWFPTPVVARVDNVLNDAVYLEFVGKP